jgi:acetoin:2,6-dichlorophenolindophenol oxidoreductase subunit beta
MANELNRALHEAMAADPRVHVLGEDILDPYGGAFKVTKGLSDTFGTGRVHTTPISEAAIAGLASGMALRGLRPVAEIMFGDFLTLCMDQIVNHIAKWRGMYNDQVTVPLVIRTPMGGRRGYGPTHSQSIEARFMGLPDMKVVAPTRFGSPADLLLAAIADDDPVLFIEYKTEYPLRLENTETKDKMFRITSYGGEYPVVRLTPSAGEPRGALICYGGMADLCVAAARRLGQSHDLPTEVLIYACMHPLDISPAATCVEVHGRAVVVEEGIRCFGWGSEVAASLTEQAFEFLEAPVARVGSRLSVIGTSRQLEDWMLPSVDDVVRAALGAWQ